MSFFTDGKPVYVLKRPRATEKPVGYSIYRAREVLIEPSARGVSYECRAAWVINRSEDDFWSTHMMLPTVGVAVETRAAGFHHYAFIFNAGIGDDRRTY